MFHVISIYFPPKTNNLRILQSHYNHQEVPSAAWIGLRANGTASQVAWTWSSGRPLGSETFSKREVEDFNELAVRENKLCVMAKKEYGQVNDGY